MNKMEKNHKKVHEKSPSQLSTANLLWQNPILTFFTLDSFHLVLTQHLSLKLFFFIFQSTDKNVSFFDATTLSPLLEVLEENKVKSVLDLG